MIHRIVIFAAILLLCVTSAEAQRPKDLLPYGQVLVEVMEQYAPPRLAELSQALQQAAQADPAWWQEHVRQAQPGQALPYDHRMRLSEPEYRELLALADSVRLRPARVDTIVIVNTDSGLRLQGSDQLAAFAGIEIDTVRDVVVTPFGELTASAPISPSDGQRATGRWGGPRWQIELMNEATVTGVVATFALGRHESGRTVIYYDARQVENGTLTARESHFLMVRD